MRRGRDRELNPGQGIHSPQGYHYPTPATEGVLIAFPYINIVGMDAESAHTMRCGKALSPSSHVNENDEHERYMVMGALNCSRQRIEGKCASGTNMSHARSAAVA